MKNIRSCIVNAALLVHAAHAIPTFQIRSMIPPDGCSGDQPGKIQEALASCADIAQKAAQGAESGGALFQAFFKTTDSNTMKQVAARFRAIAGECSSQGGGKLNIHCSNAGFPQAGCGGLTYGVSYPGNIYLCPHFYEMPVSPESCNGFTNNRACALIHELTHRDEVFAPATEDTYGVSDILNLNAGDALRMADTYSLFALYTAKGCKAPTKEDPFNLNGDNGSSTATPPPATAGQSSNQGGTSNPNNNGNPADNSSPVNNGGPTSNGSPPGNGQSPNETPTTGGQKPPSSGNTGASNTLSSSSTNSPVCYTLIDGKWSAQSSTTSAGANTKASICYEFVNGKWSTKGVQTTDGSKWK